MEFTEIQELNNLTTHARTFQSRQIFSLPDESLLSARKPMEPTTSPNLFDYEKALEDTPPESPSKHYAMRAQKAVPVLGEERAEETIDEIMGAIQSSLIEQYQLIDVNPYTLKKGKSGQGNDAEIEREEQDDKSDDEEKEKNEKSEPLNRQFEKMEVNDVSKTYIETKNLKSFLSHSIKEFPMSRQEYSPVKRGEIKTFRIFFLNEKHHSIIPLVVSLTIFDAIKKCLDVFKNTESIPPGLIRFPDRPDAYVLKKDQISGGLDNRKTLKDLRMTKELILAEDPNFNPAKPFNESEYLQQARENAAKAALIQLTVYLPTEERSRANLKLGPEKQIKDIFTALAQDGKTGYTSQGYNIRHRVLEQEARWKGNETKNFLDLNLPLKSLKAGSQDEEIQLELVKKKFADEPNEPVSEYRHTMGGKQRAATEILSPDQHDQMILYNEVSANAYEEWEVIKINENGKRQTRVLGIDGFKLYNYSKGYKEQTGGKGFGDLFNSMFFSKFGTMNPERLLTDIMSARMMSNTAFIINVISEGGRDKSIAYEAADSRTANQIVAKISYLKALQEKKKGI